jgi:4-amino-4-deoxy-L-arabinose transferase-like glycosyltransferase
MLMFIFSVLNAGILIYFVYLLVHKKLASSYIGPASVILLLNIMLIISTLTTVYSHYETIIPLFTAALSGLLYRGKQLAP